MLFKKQFYLVLRRLCLVLLFIAPVSAQESEAERRYYECADILANEGYVRGRAAYMDVAHDFPGTDWAASALMIALQWTEPPEDMALLQRVISEYAGTKWEVPARLDLLTLQHGMDDEGCLVGVNELAQSLGGPSLQQILVGETESFASQFRTLAPLRQRELWHIYNSMWLIFGQDMGRYEEALPLAIFVRETFVLSGIMGRHGTGVGYIAKSFGLHFEGSQEAYDPIVEISPAQNAVVGPLPTLVVKAFSGSLQQQPLDLAKIQLLLDGQDVKPLAVVRSKIDNTPQPNQPFETVTVTVAADTPLAPGSHILSVVVPTRPEYGHTEFGQTSVTRTFIVGISPPSPTTETLTTTKDAIIDNFDPNGNEGANGILALDKLLGRSSRSLVAFDLSDTDTNRLTKATLVLSIHKEEKILGCGGGENVSVQALTNPWVEGNGKSYKVFPLTQRRRGSGSGATWNRDTDTNIANLVPNGGTAWKGAQSATMPRTAPLVMARDHMEGTLSFDVTDDVINGAPHGWLVRKQHENLASRISFYSKEGATTKGDPNLAPRLILEYGEPTAQAELEKAAQAVASFLGLQLERPMALQPRVTPLEGGKRWKEVLQESPRAAFLAEQVATGLAGQNPLSQLGAQLAYRTWLRGELSLA